jgi:uncharacterized protein (DUF2384 family)
MSSREPSPALSKEAIYNYAREVFGDPRKVHSWMETPNTFLRSMRPKDFLEYASDEDMRLVFDELSRIDHGVF